MITTDTSNHHQDDVPASEPSSSPQPTKFHQRLTHSFSIRASSSTSTSSSQLHRSQSLAFNDKSRRPSGVGLNMIWRQQQHINTDVANNNMTPSATSSTANTNTATSTPTTKRRPSIMDKELPRVPNSSLSSRSSTSLSPLDRIKPTSPPTLREFYTWINEYITPLSRANHIISTSKLVIAKECLCRFLDNVDDETLESKITLKNQLQIMEIPTQSSFPVLAEILKSLIRILTALKPTLHYPSKLIDIAATTPPSYTLESPCITTALDYDAQWPDHLARNTHWFRQFFRGKDYSTIFVPIGKGGQVASKSMYAIITAIQESTTLSNSNGNDIATTTIQNNASQYRIIVRHPKHPTGRYLVSDTQAQNYLTKKDEYTLGKNSSPKPIKPHRRSIRSQQGLNTEQHSLMNAAILSVRPELDMDNALHLSAATITACNLEKELIRLDGIEVPPVYKFGVLTIKENQTKEEQWFSNTGLTPPFDQFLTVLGTRIQLKGYKGYTAGLDTRTNETGDTSVVSRWNNHEIMFHIAPLMPLHQNDKQQVQRKRYIGNDIVCVVFLEDNAIFDPMAIRSKFLHVYIVARRETISNKYRWRIEVVRKNNVPEFGPSLPNPPLFDDDEALQKFLTLKLINAENAALKCENFSIPNNRARAGILEGMIEKGLEELSASSPPTSSSSPTSKLGSALMERQQSQPQRRPKSSSGDRRSRTSLRSIRSNPDNASGSLPSFQLNNNSNNTTKLTDPAAPPVPSPTRSTMLQDLKRFALRRAPTLSSLQHRSATVKEEESNTRLDNNDDNDHNTATTTLRDEPKKQPQYTNSLPSSTSFQSGGVSNNDPVIQRSFLASKARTPFFKSTATTMDSPQPTTTATTSQVPNQFSQNDGLRYKTQNLMINVVGRRTSPRPMVTPLND